MRVPFLNRSACLLTYPNRDGAVVADGASGRLANQERLPARQGAAIAALTSGVPQECKAETRRHFDGAFLPGHRNFSSLFVVDGEGQRRRPPRCSALTWRGRPNKGSVSLLTSRALSRGRSFSVPLCGEGGESLGVE